ncbi:helix-turn-helix transcriptional regulator [Salinibacillus kushneri]|nr:helix-turn-helix transcriptional regulator [Salinibacillus kushneri]
MIVEHQNGLLLMRNDHLGERNWRSDDSYKFIFSGYGKSVFQSRNQGDITLDTNHFLILNPKIEHKQLHVTDEKFLVEVNYSLLKEMADQLGMVPIDPEFAFVASKNQQLSSWVSFMKTYFNHRVDTSLNTQELFLDNSMIQLALLMLQYGTGTHQQVLPSIHLPSVLEDVVDALKQSYDMEWTLDDMAILAGVNKYQFAHLFKKETGLSPYSWLQIYRLLKTQEWLRYTDDSILSIALKVGFRNISSYNQLFKRVYGKTPSEFRLSYRKNR